MNRLPRYQNVSKAQTSKAQTRRTRAAHLPQIKSFWQMQNRTFRKILPHLYVASARWAI